MKNFVEIEGFVDGTRIQIAAEEILSLRHVEETVEIFYRLRYVLGGIFFDVRDS